MTHSVLRFFCPKCNAKNLPFGEEAIQTPHSATVVCTSCNYKVFLEWMDDDLKKAQFAKERGLSQTQDNSNTIQILQNKIDSLEARADADRNEIQNLRQLIDLVIQRDILELKEKASGQEYDKNFLQGQITKLGETLEEIKSLSLKDHKVNE